MKTEENGSHRRQNIMETFHIKYKGQQERPFDWMYIDYNTLQNAAYANGLQCKLIQEGEHFDYLAQLRHLG